MSGISWVSPCAPTLETEFGLKPDSACTRPFRSAGSTPWSRAACWIRLSYWVSVEAGAVGVVSGAVVVGAVVVGRRSGSVLSSVPV